LEARSNNTYPLIDTHAHLEEVQGLKEALEEANACGVKKIIAVGSDLASSKNALKIAKEFKDLGVYAALGLHPGNLEGEDIGKTIEFIEANIAQAVAVGEIGLDYWYKPARKPGPARDLQNEVFKRQLILAKKHNLPVSIHSRGAWKECLEMVKDAGVEKCVFHWYSGPQDILASVLEAGFFISATPAAEYSPEHRRAIEMTPIEKIFLETDSPVSFKPESGRYESRPEHTLRSLKAVSQIKGVSQEVVASITTEKAVEFFCLGGGFQNGI